MVLFRSALACLLLLVLGLDFLDFGFLCPRQISRCTNNEALLPVSNHCSSIAALSGWPQEFKLHAYNNDFLFLLLLLALSHHGIGMKKLSHAHTLNPSTEDEEHQLKSRR